MATSSSNQTPNTKSPNKTNVNMVFEGVSLSNNHPVIIHSTAPDNLLAKRIAHHLVEEGLAACVNLSAESLSMYMWKGVLEGQTEVSLTIKTTAAQIQSVANRLHELHPYEVPELLVLPVKGGSKAYVEWLIENSSNA